jgi:hypothetical protein
VEVVRKPKVDATLTFWGENLIPEVLTAFLDQTPTHVREKGQRPSPYPPLRPSLTKLGMWSFCTAKACPSHVLSDHLALIAAGFGSKIDMLRKKGWVDQARLHITIMLEEAAVGATWEDEIEAGLLDAISELKVPLYISVLSNGSAGELAAY